MTHPSDASVPIRTCIGCQQRLPQTQLIRCVLDATGAICVSRTAAGRGAWLCGSGCIEPARKRRAFARAWRTAVAPDAIDRFANETADLAGPDNID